MLPGKVAPFQMRMFNPDGTEAEMCGNAIRCFAKYVCDRGLAPDPADIAVETGAGLLHLQPPARCRRQSGGSPGGHGGAEAATQGHPTTLAEDDAPVIAHPLTVGGRTLAVTTVSMGNPHAVVFVDDVKNYPVAAVGPLVGGITPSSRNASTPSSLKFFPTARSTSASGSAAQRDPGLRHRRLRRCRRRVLNGKTARRVLVHLPGGDLTIEWSEADGHVYMTGPAAEVFEGQV